MDKSRRLDLSKYRFERAQRSLKISKRDFDCGDFNDSASRSYYAVFYALLAVTELEGFESAKHFGVISYFNRNYIKTGIFDSQTSKLISKLFKMRRYADYQGFYITPKEDAETQINNAESIINMIRPYLESRWAEIIKEEENFMDAIFTRVSTRQFESREVESKYIIKILRAAMAAPSAMNQQPWEFWVITDKDLITRLSQVTPYTKPAANAPVLIVPCYNTEYLIVPDMVNIDMAISVENILLEAESLGLGAVMLGIAPDKERMKAVEEILQLPENFRAFTIIPVGWPVNKHPQEDRYEPSRVHVI